MTSYELRLQALAAQGLAEALRESGEDEAGVECGLASETDLHEAARAVVRDVITCEAHAEAAKGLARQYKDRASRLEARAQRGRGALLAALETVGLRKLPLPEATISAGQGQPGVVITDEALVPLTFRKADPRIEAAFHQLMRGEVLARAGGFEEAADGLKEAAQALLDLFMIDRKALAEALKEGREVPGAMLGNAMPWLTVRK